jgi:hypothetical protein
MKKIYTKLTFTLLTINLFFLFFSNTALAVTCEALHVNFTGECVNTSENCPTGMTVDNSRTQLCPTGQKCCYKTAADSATELKPTTSEDLKLQIPIFDFSEANNIAQYIAILYKYVLIILVPFTIIMIIIGGIQWVLAAGESSKITAAKKQIIQAFTGLFIGLFSYIILALIGITTIYVPGITNIDPILGAELKFDAYRLNDFETGSSGVGTSPAGGPIVAGDFICPKDNCCDDNASGKLVPITSGGGISSCSGSDCRVREQTLAHLKTAAQAAQGQGCSFQVTSAFRSLAKQQELWNAYQNGTGNPAARPDATCKIAPHQTGGAVDLAITCGTRSCRPDAGKGKPNCANPELKKIMENIMFSANFTRFGGEHWHFEYGTTKWQRFAGKAY